MKLLLYNNLPYKLFLSLQKHFEETNHVRNLLHPEVYDNDIWNNARNNNFHILTKDNDFKEWSLFKGMFSKNYYLLCSNQTAFIF